MYKVIKFFTDLQDSDRPYNVGDVFPHKDCSYPVTEKRLAELASRNNLQRTPLIRYVEEAVKEEPKKPAAKRAKKTADK
jgi:hypothetical protein